MKVAIIGAGIAGLSCADALAARGGEVVLFDKGRGAGGRLSTRRQETVLGEAAFDYGAPCFTVRDPGFDAVVRRWRSAGLVARWPEAGAGAWVGVPGMNALVHAMARKHDARFGICARALHRDGAGWQVVCDAVTFGPFDAVVVATPAEQAANLLSLHDFAMARAALAAPSLPCWTAMFVPERPLTGCADVIRDAGIIALAARNSSKPGREGPEAWVVHATPGWSLDHIEDSPEAVLSALRQAFAALVGEPGFAPLAERAHRWRYARPAATGNGALWNPALALGACGDWLLGDRIEAAWLSGQALAHAMTAGVVAGAASPPWRLPEAGNAAILPD